MGNSCSNKETVIKYETQFLRTNILTQQTQVITENRLNTILQFNGDSPHMKKMTTDDSESEDKITSISKIDIDKFIEDSDDEKFLRSVTTRKFNEVQFEKNETISENYLNNINNLRASTHSTHSNSKPEVFKLSPLRNTKSENFFTKNTIQRTEELQQNRKLTNESINRSPTKLFSSPGNIHSRIEIKFNELENLKILKESNKEMNDYELILNCLFKMSFMKEMSRDPNFWRSLIKDLPFCQVESNKLILQQNSFGKNMFIIKQGAVQMLINNKLINEIRGPCIIGEKALLDDTLRSFSAKTVESCCLYILSKENFNKILEFMKNQQNLEEKLFLIKNCFIFKLFPEEKFEIIARNMIREYYNEKESIIKDSSTINSFFILAEGEIEMRTTPSQLTANSIILDTHTGVKKIISGELFGHLHFILNKQQSFSLYSLKVCVLFTFSFATVKEILGENYLKQFENLYLKQILLKDKYFSKISDAFNNDILNEFTLVFHNRGEIALESNTKINDHLIIILHGDLFDEKSKKRIKNMYGNILCSQYVYENVEKVFDKNLKAFPDCLLAKIEVSFLKEMFDKSFEEVYEDIEKLEICKKSKIFNHLSEQYLKNMVKFLSLESYEEEEIFKEGTNHQKFYLIKSGEVELNYISNSDNIENKILSLKTPNYFGEKALINEKLKQRATAYASGEVELYSLTKYNFNKIFENNINLKEYTFNSLLYVDKFVLMNDLLFFDENLSHSKEYLIYLTQHGINQTLYFMRIYDNRLFYEDEIYLKNIIVMKQVLEKLDHPFISKLVRTFKDKNYIYFMFEYLEGRDLFEVIREVEPYNYNNAKFWGFCILLALKHIHKNNVIFRDLKPENIYILKNVNNVFNFRDILN